MSIQKIHIKKSRGKIIQEINEECEEKEKLKISKGKYEKHEGKKCLSCMNQNIVS